MTDTLSLQGKVAIVTGSGRENGIGAGVALALARNGASVVINYVSDSSKDRAANVCKTLLEAGGKAIVVQASVDTLEGAQHLVNKTLEGFETDHIDILVNNAGTGFLSPITMEPNVEQLAKVFQTNVLGPFYMVHYVVPHMPSGGRIINISSTNSKRGNTQISAYAASKAALDNLTWTWAGELGRSKGITVNSVAPGPVITDIYPEGSVEQVAGPEIAVTRAADRPGTPADIGDAVLLLVNEKSRWITGQYISPLGLCDGTPFFSAHQIKGEQYRDLVKRLANQANCIYLADITPPSPHAGASWFSLSKDMTSNGIHPNDEGHRKMAYVFYAAIKRAIAADKVEGAAPLAKSQPEGCDKAFANGQYAGITQKGSGEHDGIYSHSSEEKGVVLTLTSEYDRNQWFFARLYGPKYDDLLGWWNHSMSENIFGVHKNMGNGKFTKIGELQPNMYCNPRGIRWMDMNADGYDDMLCIYPNGDLYLSVNQRDGTDSKPPTFSYKGKIKSNEGFAQDRVRLADIDGDGRGDYGVLDNGGNVRFWRNGWVKDTRDYWQSLGTRFTAKGMGDMRGVRFGDINGDGRDDWLWVSDIGATTIWTNARSCKAGKEGDGLNVAWRQGFLKGKTSGPTHLGMAAWGSGGHRDRIHFARIYGEPMSFGLLPKLDYVFLQHTKEKDGTHKYQMRVWKNKGTGGTKLLADGNKYCNMMGHEDGRSDYVWTLSTGKMTLYPSQGRKYLSGGQTYWGMNKVIWDPTQQSIGKQLDRRDLHLVDYDGDGVCDIVWTDPDNNNKMHLWRNTYKETKTWTWQYNANPAPGVSCNQRRGLGIHDLPVRLADITGNKKTDYLCLEKDGRVTGFVQEDNKAWSNVGQIKFTEAKDRANLRWADVNGDGRADMVFVDKFTGDGSVWYNRGRGDPGKLSGSSFEWEKITRPVYDGSYAGTCQFFTDLDGNGRADLHSIMGTWTNQAETWYNPSCGLTDAIGDDPGGVKNPNLPVQPGNSIGDGGSDDNDESGPPTYNADGDDALDYGCELKLFNTLDDMDEVSDSISQRCGPQTVLPILQKQLGSSVDRYNKIIQDGYDGHFSKYAGYVSSNAVMALLNLMQTKGNLYFDCEVNEKVMCCYTCHFLHGEDDPQCRHCSTDICKELPDGPGGDEGPTRWEKIKQACPPDYSQRGVGDPDEATVHWSLRDKDRDAFFATVYNDVGADEEHLVWGKKPAPAGELDRPCTLDPDWAEYCYDQHWWFNAPSLKDFDKEDVDDPKDSVKKALEQAGGLGPNIAGRFYQIMTGSYEQILDSKPGDVVDAVTLPVFLVDESIKSMENVVEMAKEIEQAEKKDFILAFITAILFILPVLGQGLGALGLTTLGRVLATLGEAGALAEGIYGAVDDPESAPLLVLDFIFAGAGMRDTGRTAKAADIRRGMTNGNLKNLSPEIARKMGQVDKVTPSPNRTPLCRR